MKGYKLCILGYAGVGKTSLIKLYETGEFPEQYGATIGMDFITKIIELQGEELRLSLWDFAGTNSWL